MPNTYRLHWKLQQECHTKVRNAKILRLDKEYLIRAIQSDFTLNIHSESWMAFVE